MDLHHKSLLALELHIVPSDERCKMWTAREVFCCAAGFVNSILLLKQFRSGNYSFGHIIDFAS